MQETERLKGLPLSSAYFDEIIRPLLAECFPHLKYAAALIGPGSEVLGFDDARSTDHDWGLRLQLFVEHAETIPGIDTMLAKRLPEHFRGLPTRFSRHEGTVRHQVEVTTTRAWFLTALGFDPGDGIGLGDWLAIPFFRLAEVTGGTVFHDAVGALSQARAALSWYPDPLWYWVLACQWHRLEREDALAGRAAEAGDELGSRIITARLARDMMQLWLLMHRVYPPYGKWLGTAFARLPDAHALDKALSAALDARNWQERQSALTAAFEATGRKHDRLGLTPPIEARVRPFHDRPFLVLHCGQFVEALTARITDPGIARLPLVGTVGQFLDSTDASVTPGLPRHFAAALLQNRD